MARIVSSRINRLSIMRAILFLALALVFLLSVDAAVEENKCAPTYTTADFPCTIPDGSDADDIANQQFVTGQNDVQARAMDMTSVRVAEFVKAKVNKDLVAQVKTDRAIDNKQWLRLKRVAAMAQITTNFFPISNKDKSDVLASMKTKGRVLNFFETGLSSAAGGDPGFTSRNQLESYLFCYPIFKNGEEIANKLAPFMAKKGGPACEGRARPKYAALNVYGYTLGAAPNYGTMAAVLDIPANFITVTAQDTFGIKDGNQVGTLQHIDHVLADHLKSAKFGTPRIKRLLGKEYAADQNEEPWSYIEAQVHSDIRFSLHTKEFRASFTHHFGTAEGDALLKWAQDIGKPLVWAYVPDVKKVAWEEMRDPRTLEGSDSPKYKAKRDLFKTLVDKVKGGEALDRADWDSLYKAERSMAIVKPRSTDDTKASGVYWNDRTLKLKGGTLTYWTTAKPPVLKGTILLSKIKTVDVVDRGKSLLGERYCIDVTEIKVYRFCMKTIANRDLMYCDLEWNRGFVPNLCAPKADEDDAEEVVVVKPKAKGGAPSRKPPAKGGKVAEEIVDEEATLSGDDD